MARYVHQCLLCPKWWPTRRDALKHVREEHAEYVVEAISDVYIRNHRMPEDRLVAPNETERRVSAEAKRCAYCPNIAFANWVNLRAHLVDEHLLVPELITYGRDWYDLTWFQAREAEAVSKFEGELKLVDNPSDFLIACGASLDRLRGEEE